MTDGTDSREGGWFEAGGLDDADAGAESIRERTATRPRDWPRLAVESGAVDSTAAYYDRLHEVAMGATRAAVDERTGADDQALKHRVRALDDCRRVANELTERVVEWAEALGQGEAAPGQLAVDEDVPREVRSLAQRVVDLADEAESLERAIEREAPSVAPNLSALAGPILAARLVSLAGSLESLAKKPSGTVQVLGAEEALFAHLQGHAPSPKHGVIYTHEAVHGTRPQDRGSAARALAGKLSIAARVDHYSGEYRPELEAELEGRLATIRARAEDDAADRRTGRGNGPSEGVR